MTAARQKRLDYRRKHEAALWVARLHADDSRESDAAELRAWLAESAENRRAFDLATTVWDYAGAVRPSSMERPRRLRAFAVTLFACIAMGTLSLGGTITRPSGYQAIAGNEQRRVALPDGSVALLDAGAGLFVSIDDSRRQVRLLNGRAYFDVAHDAGRPFTVFASGRRIVALGTAFEVTSDATGNELAVALVEGRLAVSPASDSSHAELMKAGDRLVFKGNRLARADRPEPATIATWRFGRLTFEAEPLAAAAARFKAAGGEPILIDDAQLAAMPISGVYSAGDPEAFARSAALLLDARVTNDGEAIRITSRQASKK